MGAETARQDTEIARRIFRFLAEAEQTRLRPIRTLSSAHRKLWFSELPTGSDYVASGLLDPDQKAWLRIKRIHQQEPPAVPEVLEPWITLSDLYCYQNTEPPKLRERITDIDLVDDIDDIDLEAPREIFLDDHEDRDQIRKAYASWSAQWMKWAERERETAEAVRHYETLYRMREEMEDLGESYELVLGFGYLTWKSDGKPVGRHLVTRKMVITLDDTGALTLAPDPETPDSSSKKTCSTPTSGSAKKSGKASPQNSTRAPPTKGWKASNTSTPPSKNGASKRQRTPTTATASPATPTKAPKLRASASHPPSSCGNAPGQPAQSPAGNHQAPRNVRRPHPAAAVPHRS